MRPENALLSRRAFKIDQGRWCIEERWDIERPDCPFVAFQGLNNLPPENPYIVQRILSEAEYQQFFGRLT